MCTAFVFFGSCVGRIVHVRTLRGGAIAELHEAEEW